MTEPQPSKPNMESIHEAVAEWLNDNFADLQPWEIDDEPLEQPYWDDFDRRILPLLHPTTNSGKPTTTSTTKWNEVFAVVDEASKGHELTDSEIDEALDSGKGETPTIDDAIFAIEDYVGGNIEGVETVDRMAFTAFLRQTLDDIDYIFSHSDLPLTQPLQQLLMYEIARERQAAADEAENRAVDEFQQQLPIYEAEAVRQFAEKVKAAGDNGCTKHDVIDTLLKEQQP